MHLLHIVPHRQLSYSRSFTVHDDHEPEVMVRQPPDFTSCGACINDYTRLVVKHAQGTGVAFIGIT